MTNWRPEEWRNPYGDWFGKGELTLKEDYETNQHFAFEAGADAMLEVIWEMASNSPTKTFTFDSRTINIYGRR